MGSGQRLRCRGTAGNLTIQIHPSLRTREASFGSSKAGRTAVVQCEIIQGRAAGKDFEPSGRRSVWREFFAAPQDPQPQFEPWPLPTLGSCAERSFVSWAIRLEDDNILSLGKDRPARFEDWPQHGQGAGWSYSLTVAKSLKTPQLGQSYW